MWVSGLQAVHDPSFSCCLMAPLCWNMLVARFQEKLRLNHMSLLKSFQNEVRSQQPLQTFNPCSLFLWPVQWCPWSWSGRLLWYCAQPLQACPSNTRHKYHSRSLHPISVVQPICPKCLLPHPYGMRPKWSSTDINRCTLLLAGLGRAVLCWISPAVCWSCQRCLAAKRH
jgi:hypothetical protein